MRKTLAVLLVLLGLGIALYPWGQNLYRDYRIGKHLVEFEESQDLALPLSMEEPETPREPQEEKEDPSPGPAPIAVLKIVRIDLELPVLPGATESNLRYGAALLEGAVGIGERGNAVITAHRAHTYGRLFNRLDELEQGDELALVTPDKRYDYRVVETAVVEATDTAYLAGHPEEQLLTLITCHPLYVPNPPYRLVVQARLVER